MNEASAGDADAAGKRLAALAGIPLLDVNFEVEKLAQKLIADKVLTGKSVTYALHIAVAAVHGVNYLLSWNCKHIANAEMQSAIEKACTDLGYKCSNIRTPEHYWEASMTWDDEIVDEVRRVRDEHAAKFDYDIAAICAGIRRKQAESKGKVVVVGEREGKEDRAGDAENQRAA
jgi:hypothetical protein